MTSHLFPAAEQLESRVLLAFASLNSHGILSVVGTSKNNKITVDVNAATNEVRAVRDGSILSFPFDDVKGIWLNAFNGNDRVFNATGFPSTLIGAGGNDTITGGGGTDSIDAGTGADHVNGGGGGGVLSSAFNEIFVDGADDVLDYSQEQPGGFELTQDDNDSAFYVRYRDVDGRDKVHGFSTLTVVLTPGDDNVGSSFRESTINAKVNVDLGAGNDSFLGTANIVSGNAGNDNITFNADAIARQVFGGSGKDHIVNAYGGPQTTLIDGGSGTDQYDVFPDEVALSQGPYHHDVPGAVENMLLELDGDHDLVVNGNGLNNMITVFCRAATVHGGSGNDFVTVRGTNAKISSVYGDSGDDTLFNGNGPDVFWGGSGEDVVDYSESGDESGNGISVKLDNKANDGWIFDALEGTGGNLRDDVRADVEAIFGGRGNDYLQGGPFNEGLFGGEGNDTIWAGAGNDVLDGGAGHDMLFGQDGNDSLFARDGEKDSLDGGAGSDTGERDNTSTLKDSLKSVEVLT